MPELPIRPRWILLAIIMLWFGLGMIFQSPRNGATDPVEAATPLYMTTENMQIILMEDGPTDVVGCLANCWFADPVNARAVLFQDRLSDDPQDYKLGLIYQHGTTWHRTYEVSGSFRTLADSDRSLQADAHFLEEGTSWMYRWGILQNYVLIVGHTTHEQVSHVELVHDTGQVTRADIIDGYFAGFAPARALCEVRARDGDRVVVERLISGESMAIRPHRYGPGASCTDVLTQAETS